MYWYGDFLIYLLLMEFLAGIYYLEWYRNTKKPTPKTIKTMLAMMTRLAKKFLMVQ